MRTRLLAGVFSALFVAGAPLAGVAVTPAHAQASVSVEFRTAYTYDVRWGLVGCVLDRLVLRRWFQRATERSFARLCRDQFAGASSRVVGQRGGKPMTPTLEPA